MERLKARFTAEPRRRRQPEQLRRVNRLKGKRDLGLRKRIGPARKWVTGKLVKTLLILAF